MAYPSDDAANNARSVKLKTVPLYAKFNDPLQTRQQQSSSASSASLFLARLDEFPREWKEEHAPMMEEQWQLRSRGEHQQVIDALRSLLNFEILHGGSYPYINALSPEVFLSYFFSHNCFVLLRLRQRKDEVESNNDESERNVVQRDGTAYDFGTRLVGAFYVKPNFPGRSNHICNAGFLVVPQYRGVGVASLLARTYLPIARELGYRTSMFNLVFASNKPSVALWDKLGFHRNAVLKGAGRMFHRSSGGNVEYVDAIQYTYDLTSAPVVKAVAEAEKSPHRTPETARMVHASSSSSSKRKVKRLVAKL